jgi:hypothetical protein
MIPEKSHRSLNPFTNFVVFVKPYYYRAYEANIFGELADKGLSGCIPVVGADE